MSKTKRKTITATQLGPHKGRYEFTITEEDDGIFITIPGYNGGYDGPIDPRYPEQLAWMRKQKGFKEVWYLTWKCTKQNRLKKFIESLGTLHH